MGLTWNPSFISTPAGMAMLAQVVLAAVGGIVNVFSLGLATGLLGFAFWSTVVISGALTLLHVCNMAQSIESKFPYFTKVELGYVVVWIILYLVSVVMSFFSFGISNIFAYLVLVAFGVDAYFKYANYRAAHAASTSQMGPAQAGGPA